jgi:hypothetical protein
MNENAKWIVRDIDHLKLDDEEIKILKDAVQKIQDERRKHFEGSLTRAAKIVDSWPKWKRNALGHK